MLALLILYLTGGLLLVLLALPLLWEKIGPNGLYGFRVRATLNNPRVWYAVNRFAAKRFIWSGGTMMVAAPVLYFVPGLSPDGYALSCAFVFGVTFLIGLIQTTRYLRSLVAASNKQ